ncbi:MAG TPA: RsmE family RNA methyltransferase [Candidatus Acidoferrum sp.]|nr:RsmE family RNA methyltransferase [Candidatus Acidoferrum sp.]
MVLFHGKISVMRRRFFIEQFVGQRAVMEGEAAHHLGRVLRAQPGQLYELSDGSKVWLGRIDSVTRNSVEFSLVEEIPAYHPRLQTTLLLSVVKFDSFEWALEKATELGVSRIVPLAAARSEKALLTAAVKRAERWMKLLLEASQQSRRVQLPILDSLAKPETAFAACEQGLRVFLSESPDAKPLREVLRGQQTKNAVLAIGPEGGWTDEELATARTAQFQDASLGKLILRTETAVVASLAAFNFALSD